MSLRRTTSMLAALVLSVLMVGCASQPKSQAYMLNESLGGHRIQDEPTNEDHQRSSPLLKHGILIAGANYESTAGLGLSGFEYEGLANSLIIALLDIASPKSYENTWIVGRLPMNEEQSGRDLHGEIFDTYLAAAKKVLDESGLEYEAFEYDKKVHRGPEIDLDDTYEFEVFIINAPEFNCEFMITDEGKNDSNCALMVRAGGLETGYAPVGHELNGEESWELPSRMRHEIKFTLNNGGFLPTMEMHKRFSEELPGWAYMFIPDAEAYPVLNVKGEAKGYPYFLNQGQELHFVKPKSKLK
ncbi:hypothetical protein [Marinobacter sp. F3R08]|uniref:hypothetical protein n=1 Tax=Marinobacter sp. F3R08 TaxID=2841559 RepID=UPI001C08AB7D|nr:hypothetical protein [Marinobacter sp. F3R08]MBU2952215.1 hypothetical protein [Marinobacter sp. F3R08]